VGSSLFVFRPASLWLVVRRRSSSSRSVVASPQLSELVVLGWPVVQAVRSLASRCRPSMLRRNRLTFHSSGRLRRRLIPALGFKSISGHCQVGAAPRSRFASASFLRCVSGQPACVVRGRLVVFRNVHAGVCSRVHLVLGGRGVSQRHHFVSGSSVVRRLSPSRVLVVRLVWHYRSSKVVLRCRLTVRSRRTASPPLNFSVRRS
jgi:hypothetical protein